MVAAYVPGPSHVQYLAGRRPLHLVPYVPTAQQIRVSAAMVSYAGQVTIAITADAHALPDADRLIAAVGHEIGELVAQGSHTQPKP